jgi:hypothetical protein
MAEWVERLHAAKAAREAAMVAWYQRRHHCSDVQISEVDKPNTSTMIDTTGDLPAKPEREPR